MILVGNNCETITVQSSVIETVATDVGQYDTITINIATNCGENVETVINTPFSDTGAEAYISGNDLVLNPTILGEGFTTFSDAVYTVNIKATRTGGTGFDVDEGCFFNDCKTKCQVSEYISLLIKDKPDMEIHMLHFALLEGSNCGCNCELLCEAWTKLQELLASQGLGAGGANGGSASDSECATC